MRWAVAVPMACALGRAAGATVVTMPDGRPGIGFDDLRFVAGLGVLVPGGRSGRLDVVDPATLAVSSVDGFARERSWGGGHDQGATSADAGAGWLFVTD